MIWYLTHTTWTIQLYFATTVRMWYNKNSSLKRGFLSCSSGYWFYVHYAHVKHTITLYAKTPIFKAYSRLKLFYQQLSGQKELEKSSVWRCKSITKISKRQEEKIFTVNVRPLCNKYNPIFTCYVRIFFIRAYFEYIYRSCDIKKTKYHLFNRTALPT